MGNGLSDIELVYDCTMKSSVSLFLNISIEWEKQFGDTIDFVRAAGERISDCRWVKVSVCSFRLYLTINIAIYNFLL